MLLDMSSKQQLASASTELSTRRPFKLDDGPPCDKPSGGPDTPTHDSCEDAREISRLFVSYAEHNAKVKETYDDTPTVIRVQVKEGKNSHVLLGLAS